MANRMNFQPMMNKMINFNVKREGVIDQEATTETRDYIQDALEALCEAGVLSTETVAVDGQSREVWRTPKMPIVHYSGEPAVFKLINTEILAPVYQSPRVEKGSKTKQVKSWVLQSYKRETSVDENGNKVTKKVFIKPFGFLIKVGKSVYMVTW